MTNSVNKKAKWIWYANDFELLAYHKMSKKRIQREDVIYPTWVMDRPEYQVVFEYRYDVPEDTSFKVYANGEICVNIAESSWNVENNKGDIPLKAGKGILRIYCMAEKDLPTIFINSKYIKTDESWECYCVDNVHIPASCSDLFTTKNYGPHNYALKTKKLNYITKEKHGDGILFDFGRELMGTPVAITSRNVVLQLYYGESSLEALDFENSEVCEKLTAIANEKTVGPQSRGFRYIFVKNAKYLKDLYLLEEKYTPSFKPYFRSSDSRVNKIYSTAKYTLEVTSREFFIDGPKRDRWVWAGDALQSEWFDFYTFFDKEIVKRTIRALIGKQKIKSNVNGILDYNFYYILSVYYYYYYTGDVEFIKEIYPRLVSLMEFIFTKPKVDGFLMAHDEWIFIDWVNYPNFSALNNKYPVCLIQILYYKALETMIKFEDLLGIEHNPKYAEEICGFKDRINEVFFDETLGGYYHDTAHTLKTKYGNIFAVLLDFATEEQKRAIAKSMNTAEFKEIVTPYMKLYELCAQAELGNMEQVLDYMDFYWGGMLDQGATTFWEKYVPSQKGAEVYEMYGRKYGKSLCHSWGAGPLYLLGKYVVGLSPLDSAYEEYKLKPYLSKLKFKTHLPVNDGSISVEYTGACLKVKSLEKDGVLIANENMDVTNLVYSEQKGGYILSRGTEHVIKIKEDAKNGQ